jgi:hypothetical protein
MGGADHLDPGLHRWVGPVVAPRRTVVVDARPGTGNAVRARRAHPGDESADAQAQSAKAAFAILARAADVVGLASRISADDLEVAAVRGIRYRILQAEISVATEGLCLIGESARQSGREEIPSVERSGS